jgi:hypothetical protein
MSKMDDFEEAEAIGYTPDGFSMPLGKVKVPKTANQDTEVDETNQYGVDKWLVEALKSYDGLMATGYKGTKMKAKRELLTALNAHYKSILLEVIGEDSDVGGVLIDEDGDPVNYEEIRNELKVEQRQRLESRLG